MTEYSQEKVDGILGKVRALIANAEDPATPEEARDAYRQRAEALMFKYRIDEATMVASGQFGDTVNPVLRVIALGNLSSEYSGRYRTIGGVVLRHVGARGHVRYDNGTMQLNAVGYESDIRYMELLLTASLVEFGKRLEPKHDPGLSEEENAWRMRSAGMERKRIARILFGDWKSENEMKAKNRKVTRLIRLYAAQNGEDADAILGRGNNMATYRDSYADGFVLQLNRRLTRMRQAHGQEGAALVLADRQERIDEAYYGHFPNMRPSSTPAEEWKDPRGDCQKCKKAKSGYCRDHSWLRPKATRGRSFNHSAYNAGERAANMVDLGGNSTGTGRAAASNYKEI